LTETIQSIAVEDTRIWTGCEFLHNLYDNGKEVAYYISSGQINHLSVCHLTRENEYDTILACQDRYIRILHVSTPFVEIPTNFPVISLAHLELDRNPSQNGRRVGHLFFGTSKGTLGYVRVVPNGSYEMMWELEDSEKKSAINCIKLYDVNKDNFPEILIGRDDGRIEVYKFNTPDDLSYAPQCIFVKDINQSIRSIECGIVNTPDYPEIIIAAYSGKVISFTTEPIKNRSVEDTYGRSIQTVNNENRIKTLKKEIEDLKKKVDKEKEKMKKSGTNINSNNANYMKAPSDFPVNSAFDLDYALAAYNLSLELQLPIDLIILRSPVVLELIENDSGNTVLSVTPPHLNPGNTNDDGNNSSNNKFVAVFRCQSNEKRINLSLRSNEGEYGDLVITIVANNTPKVGKIIKYELKPLSLHSKVHELSAVELSRPRNRIRYTGKACTPLFVFVFLFCSVLVSERSESISGNDHCSITGTKITSAKLYPSVQS
jgi:Bardet-Biedl syndrome 7 protein